MRLPIAAVLYCSEVIANGYGAAVFVYSPLPAESVFHNIWQQVKQN